MVRRLGLYLGTALLASISFSNTPAYAGFEFVAPINQEPVQKVVPSDEDNSPMMEQSEVEPLLPLAPVKEKKIETMPLAVLPTEMDKKPTPPPIEIEKDIPPVAQPVTEKKPMAVKSMVASKTVVEGFANQIPLAIALQQVIPPQFQYAFADGVNPGTKVDWQGGKSWDQVVSDMVTPHGMIAEVSKNVVYIRNLDTAEMAPTAPKPTKELLATADEPLPLLSAEKTAPRVPQAVENSLLFDSAQNAQVSGVSRPKPKPALVVTSDRLDLSDLSIGQPMQLLQARPASVPTSSVSPPIEAPQPITKKVDILPKKAVMPMEPVKNKKILVDEGIDANMTAQSTQIDVLPKEQDVAMSEAKMSIIPPIMTDTETMGPSVWTAENGETLRSTLQAWSDETGTSLIWQASYDYPLQADIQISGTYEHAVRTILDGLSNAQPRPLGRLHRNQPTGQPVLVIETEALTN